MRSALHAAKAAIADEEQRRATAHSRAEMGKMIADLSRRDADIVFRSTKDSVDFSDKAFPALQKEYKRVCEVRKEQEVEATAQAAAPPKAAAKPKPLLPKAVRTVKAEAPKAKAEPSRVWPPGPHLAFGSSPSYRRHRSLW